MPALLLALSLLAAGDAVRLKDGRKLEGRIFEFAAWIELVTPDGKRVRIEREKIDRIERERRVIRFPDHGPNPHEALRDGLYDYVTRHNVLVAVPRTPPGKICALDADTGRELWSLPCRKPFVAPMFYGSWVFCFDKETAPDDKQKYKQGGGTFAKDVEKITLTAVDLVTSRPAWTFLLDNNDRADLLYGFIDELFEVHPLREHLLIRAAKKGNPLDRVGTVDKSKTVLYSDFTVWDPERQKVERTFRVDDAYLGDTLLVNDEMFVYQSYPHKGVYVLNALGMKDGKVKWKTEDSRARCVGVRGDRAYLRDDGKFWTVSLKTGKRNEKWSIDHNGAKFAALDERHLYAIRKARPPRGICIYDLKKAEEVHRIDMPEGDEFTHRALMESLLVYTNAKQGVVAFDVAALKPAWSYAPPKQGPPVSFLASLGSIVVFKDGQITLLETAGGHPLWSVPGAGYYRIQEAGDRGVICFRRAGTDLIRERALPNGAVFLNDQVAPLRHTIGADLFSVPAFADGVIYTVSNRGVLHGIRLDTKRAPVLELKVADPGPALPPAPAARGACVVAHSNGTARSYDARTGRGLAELAQRPLRPTQPFEWHADKLLVAGASSVALWDPATGGESWRCGDLGAPVELRVFGPSVYVLDGSNVHEIGLDTGRRTRAIRVNDGSAQFGIGKRIVLCARQCYRLTCLHDDKPIELWSAQTASQDPRVAMRFRGQLEFMDGTAFWANADGKLLALGIDDGKTLWSYDVKEFVSRLLVHGGRLYFVAPGLGLVALDAKTGQESWKQAVADPDRFHPVLLGEKVVFWSTDGWFVEPDSP